mgnify:CR=1 FL=1
MACSSCGRIYFSHAFLLVIFHSSIPLTSLFLSLEFHHHYHCCFISLLFVIILLQVKPTNSSVAGIKRKFEASVAECGDGTPSVNVGKEIQKEWSSALCHVTVTCERLLQEPLKGRKHKANERALRESNTKVNNNANNSN